MKFKHVAHVALMLVILIVITGLAACKPVPDSEQPVRLSTVQDMVHNSDTEIYSQIQSNNQFINDVSTRLSQIAATEQNTVARHAQIIQQNNQLRQELDMMRRELNVVIQCINVKCIKATIDTRTVIEVNPIGAGK